jgi:hypothetical protein
MAHYAYLDENNTVVAVTVGKDESELIDGLDTETYYAQGTPYTVKRTSYNGKIRKQFAAVGYFYNSTADVFIMPKPFDSWSLDKNYDWQPPISRPDNFYGYWDELSLSWIATEQINE